MTITRRMCCQFCSKEFTRRLSYEKHMCAKKKKFELAHTVTYMDAHKLYVHWLKFNNMIRRGREPDLQRFLQSHLVNDFVAVVNYCREHEITSMFDYMDWLSNNRTPARFWAKDDPMHLEKFKRDMNIYEDPMDQAKITRREVHKWLMDNPQKTPAEFFDKLSPGKVLSLMQQRTITPWVAFSYPPVLERWLGEGCSRDIYYKIDELVNCDYWIKKVTEDETGVLVVNQIMDELCGFELNP